MTARAPFRTTAQGRADIIEASETLRIEMRARRDLWQSRCAPTEHAPLLDDEVGDGKDSDQAEAFE